MSTVGELSVIFGLQSEGWEKGNALLKGLANTARTYLGVQAIKSVVGLVQHVTEATTHLVSMSAAAGLTVEQFQLFGYVAQQSGSNVRELTTGMSMFIGSMRRYVAGGGSKQFRKDMEELGVSQAEAAAALADPNKLNKLLFRVSDHVRKLGTSGNQAGFGRELFGARAGRAMVADLARGSEGLNDLFARRQKMGIISTEDAKNVRDLGNHMKDVKTSFDAIATTVIARLAPSLTKLADAAVAWVEANKDIISGALTVALEIVAGIFSTIGGIITTLSDLIHKALGGDDGATAILIGLAVAILSVVVPALWAMAAPIIAAMLPFLALAAAAALVAYGVLKLIKYGPQIKAALVNAFASVLKSCISFEEWIQNLPNRLYGSLQDVGDAIIDAFEDAWDAVKGATNEAVHYILTKMHEIPLFGALSYVAGKVDDAVYGGGDQPNSNLDADYARYNSMSPSVNVPNGGNTNVTVNAPINVTNNGVKDANEATDQMQQAVDQSMRHAMRDAGK